MLTPINLHTVADLARHDHGLAVHCWRCNRWEDLDLAAWVREGRGGLEITALRFRCRVCGESGDKVVRPPEAGAIARHSVSHSPQGDKPKLKNQGEAKRVSHRPVLSVVCLAIMVAAWAPSVFAADNEVGKRTYHQYCSYCHDDGLLGAPKFGDRAAWASIQRRSRADLVNVAWKGESHTTSLPNMPARTIRSGLNEKDVAAAVDYMLDAVR